MVHRDVKPANCLFVDGELKLADFGLLTEADRNISRIGTLAYMPPDGRMDAGADVHAAGLVIYEMLSGLPAESFPQMGKRGLEIAKDQNLTRLARLSLRACEPDATQRFTDATEMLAGLTTSRLTPRAMTGGRRWTFVASVVGLLAAVVLAAIVLWRREPLTPTTPTGTVHVNFVSYPFEATIYLDDRLLVDSEGEVCRTPCTVEDLPARAHRVVFRHQGEASDCDAGVIDFSAVRHVVVRWNAND
jgi:hypothetical protein